MEVEVWLVVNDAEESEVYTDESDAEDHGLKGAVRIVKITVKVPVPKPVEVTVTVPEEPTGAAVQVG
jgi:hypothetical protein